MKFVPSFYTLDQIATTPREINRSSYRNLQEHMEPMQNYSKIQSKF